MMHVPIVKPVAVMVSVPPLALPSAQDTFTPVQAPERKSTTASNVEDPVTLIVGVAVVAINLYHTASSAVPVHTVPKPLTAPTVVPDVAVQLDVCVKVVAVLHASLGGAVGAPYTQIVNVPVDAVDP